VIIGFGADLCDIRRIAAALERRGDLFAARLFTQQERAYCDAKAARAGAYAKRFAAKEACAKALGTGFRNGLDFRHIGVVNDDLGAPRLKLTAAAAARLAAITPNGQRAVLHLTLSDEEPYAQALVLIEALPC